MHCPRFRIRDNFESNLAVKDFFRLRIDLFIASEDRGVERQGKDASNKLVAVKESSFACSECSKVLLYF